MIEITSTSNETVKILKQLATSAKYRTKTNQTILEGIHLCHSYIQANGIPKLVAVTASARNNSEVAAILRSLEMHNVSIVQLEDNIYRSISVVENGVGLLFSITIPVAGQMGELSANSLLLEDIQDPGNMGAILRTSAAAGVTNIFTSTGSVSVWSPKVLRAGMGAHFALNVYEASDLAALAANAQIPVLATSLQAGKTIYEQDLRNPVAWIFGNEGQGVSRELLTQSVEKVIIPQQSTVESLNVAAAVAVCLFEQQRQQTNL